MRAQGRESLPAEEQKRKAPARPSDKVVSQILAQQDPQGRWVRKGWLDMQTFIRNMKALGDYLLAE